MQTTDWQAAIKKHGPAVWQIAYRLLGNKDDAADCYQETFISALQVSRRQRVRNFPALLARLATVRAIDRLRQRMSKSQNAAETSIRDVTSSSKNEPVQQLQARELAEKLRWAIVQLPEKQAQVFCLRYINDMSYRLIAKQLGIRKSTAGVLLHRARARLRELLESANGD